MLEKAIDFLVGFISLAERFDLHAIPTMPENPIPILIITV
jgi:hypothetical protein